MLKFLNKGISTPVGILIIVLVAVVLGGGVLIWQNRQLIAVPTPTPTAAREIYTDTEYGFEIEYPVDYFISAVANEVRFVHNKWRDQVVNHPYVSVEVFETEYSVDEWVKQRIEERKSQGYRVFAEGCDMHCISATAEEVRIGNNIRALQYREWGVSGGGEYYIVAEKKDSFNQLVVIYSHTAGARESGEESVPTAILDKMLSSFRFIEAAEGFCGWSTNGSCLSDSDCTSEGCSGQVCQSRNEEPITTTCEFKECYVAKNYGFECKCVNNKCRWSK